MPVFSTTSALPRQELALAILEGEGAVENLIGEQILPPFPINKRTAHLVKATLANSQALRVIDDAKFIHAPGTKFERMVATFGDDTLTVDLRGQEIVVPNETSLDYAQFLDIEAFYAGRFGQTSALTKEKLIAAQIFNTSNFGAGTKSGVAYTVANRDVQGASGMNPIQDIIAATRRVKAKGERPDTVVMSGPGAERVYTCQNTLQFVRGMYGPIAEVTPDLFAKALAPFGIKQVLVGDAYYNNAADQATASLSQVWSNTYIWVGKSGKASTGAETSTGIAVPQLAGVGANIFWEDYEQGGVIKATDLSLKFAGGNYVESYPDLSIDSMVLRVKMSNRPYLGNTRGGDLIATQYV